MTRWILPLVALLSLWTAPAWATITFSSSTSANADGLATTLVSPALAITAAQTVVVCVKWENNVTLSSITSSAGDTVTLRTAQQHSTLEPSARCGYVLSASAGASTTYTANFSSTGAIYRRVVVLVFNANGATMSFDAQSAASTEDDADTTPSSATISTTGTDEVCVALHADYTNQSFSAEVIDGVARDGRVTISDVDVFYRILTGTLTNKTASLTKSVARRWVQQLNCFKGTGGGAPPPVTLNSYYVSTTGSNTTGTGAIGNPWRTATFAAATMLCGDTTYMRGGTYSTEGTIQFSRTDCTQATPITLTNYPGETPIIAWTDKTNGNNRIYVSQSSGFTIPVTDVHINGLDISGHECVKLQASLRFQFTNNYCHDTHTGGITGTETGGNYLSTASGNIFANNGTYLHTQCNFTYPCNQFHGMYIQGTGWTITNNLFYGNLAYGIQAKSGTAAPTPNQALYGPFQGVIAHNTFAYQKSRGAITLWRNGVNMSAGTIIENNIFLENSQDYASSAQGIEFTSCGAGCPAIVRNNQWYATGNSNQFLREPVGGTDAVPNANVVVSGTIHSEPQLTNAPATMPASPAFTLTATSPAVNAGYAGLTRAANGAGTDIGRYERFGFKSATITANTMLVTLDMNIAAFNPVKPDTGMTGLTVNNGRTASPVIRLAGADSIISITVSGAACADSDTWTVSYSGTGNVTDAAGQPMSAFSAQPVTNVNCSGGAAPTAVIEQKTHQFLDAFYATGTSNVVALSAVGATNTDIHSGIPFALAIQTDCTIADCLPLGQRLYYSITPLATGTPSAFTQLTNALTDQVAFYGITSDLTVLNGDTPATCLTGALTPVAGKTNLTFEAVPIFDLALNGCTVNRYVLQLGPSAILGDIYTFKVKNQTTADLDAYTPSGGAKVTVTPVAPTSPPSGVHESGAPSNSIIELIWSPSTDPNFAGFHIYQCASTPCTSANWTRVGEQTPATAMAGHYSVTTWRTNVSAAGTYYFVIASFNTGGQETEVSAELAVTRTGPVSRGTRTP